MKKAQTELRYLSIILILLLAISITTNITIVVLGKAIFCYNEDSCDGRKIIPPPPPNESALVTRIIDGDTIDIQYPNGSTDRVRLTCIDTPERGEPGFQQASDYLENLILDKKVKLVKDISERGKYQRLIRYIYLDDLFVNKKMVEEGYAKAYPYFPDTAKCPEIQEAEKLAKEAKRGIWADKDDYIPPTPKTGYTCDSDTYNCGDFTSHKEAQEVFLACGGPSRDIHKLDRDLDGLACESLGL